MNKRELRRLREGDEVWVPIDADTLADALSDYIVYPGMAWRATLAAEWEPSDGHLIYLDGGPVDHVDYRCAYLSREQAMRAGRRVVAKHLSKQPELRAFIIDLRYSGMLTVLKDLS